MTTFKLKNMKVIKFYTAIQLDTERTNEQINVKLTYGNIDGPYYSQEHPKQEFICEQEAIEYAYKKDKYASWLILPVIRFNNFSDYELNP